MKPVYCLAFAWVFCIAACQKSVDPITENQALGGEPDMPATDTITYEVISTDTSGWFGMWMDEDSRLDCNTMDHILYDNPFNSYYGSPNYFHSGWTYRFVPKHQPFQALISVANRSYAGDIRVNLYKGGQLIKTIENDAMTGVAKLMVDIDTTLVSGTATDPVLTYEVLISDPDSSMFESDSWLGQWTMPDGTSNFIVDSVVNSLLFDFAIPSGWHYSFKPEHLPFDMSLFAVPYTEGGSNVTINFYVNYQLVKSASSRKQQRLIYTVQ